MRKSRRRVVVVVLIVIVAIVGWRVLAGYSTWKDEQDRIAEIELQVFRGLEVEYVLTPFHVAQLPAPLGSRFDVTSDGHVVLAAGEQFIEIYSGPDGVLTADVQPERGPPDSFAIDVGGGLLTITDQYFGQLEEEGFSQALPLPGSDMKLASSSKPGTVYLYGGTDRFNAFGGTKAMQRRLYIIYGDGAFDVYADLPAPIVSVADSDEAVYASTEEAIFRLPVSGPFQLVIRVDEEVGPLTSIAASPDGRTMYFSNKDSVYALHGTAAVSIINNAGGQLLYRNGKLYVWDQPRGLLVAVRGLNQLFGEGEKSS